MIKKEFMRYMRSKFHFLLLLILVSIGLASYYFSFLELELFRGQLNTVSQDLNRGALQSLIDNFGSMVYFTDFIFSNDFYQLFIIILFLGMGVSLSSTTMRYMKSGLGNTVVVRTGYKRFLKELIIAQSLYIAVLIMIVMSLLFIIALIISGGSLSPVNLGESSFAFVQMLGIVIAHIGILIVFSVVVNSITLLTPLFIKNLYIIQSFPAVMFIVIPIILGSTLANLSPFLGQVSYIMIPFITLATIPDYFITDISSTSAMIQLIPILFLIILAFIIFRLNVYRFSKEYL
ncbi:magnesium-transporting ATPase (P-type) [Natronobacillus azotifigens]|uniref:Uncharacterized protein n=1 Tax=Natronobacillus azotifigens TaxID=472978 RepID=A0A9J6RAH5_9BACI|nr:hypothetical protein [Natronobacillus azotifigens]MCZ0702257.1 hypothetical protein [Natronobacillus azotifigens]